MNVFFNLRQRMYGADITQKDIAEHLQKDRTYVCNRFRQKHPWNLDDVYKICDLLQIEYCEIPKYFPPNERA